MSLIQWVTMKLEESSKTQLAKDMEAAAKLGVDAMDAEFKRKSADIKHDMAAGLISEKEAAALGRRAAEAYNREIVAKMDGLAKAGKSTSAEYAALGDKIKTVSTAGAGHAGLMSRAWGGFKDMLVGFGPAIAAAFGVNAIINFGKQSIAAAGEAEKAWADVKVTLGNLGVPLVKAQREVEAAAAKMMASTRFGDEETVRGFNKVLQLTGDYGKSLKALGPIADLAIAKNMSFEEASNVVGKALAGNDMQLRRLIPTMEKGGDVFQALGKFAGAAAADAKTFEGQTKMMGNAFGELQESIGKVLISGGQGAGLMEMFTAAIVETTNWVEKNKMAIRFWIEMIIRAVQVVVPMITNTIGAAINNWKGQVYGMMTLFHAAVGVFYEIKAAVLEFAKVVTGAMIPVMETLEKIAAKLGFKESAEDFHKAAANLTTDFNNLALSRRQALRDVETQQEKVRENAGKLADAYKAVGQNVKGFVVDSGKALDVLIATGKRGEQSAEELGDAHETAAADTSKAWGGAADTTNKKQKEMSDAAKKAAREMSAAYDTYTGSLLAGHTTVMEAYKDFQKTAQEQSAGLQTAQENIQSAYIATGVAAQRAGSAIEQATREAKIAKEQERAAVEANHQATKDYAYDYVTQYTPAIERRTDAVTKATQRQGEAADDTGDKGETMAQKWTKGLSSIAGIAQGLGAIFGGSFSKIESILEQTVTSVGAIGNAFDALKSPTKGFLDMLSKVPSFLGGIGSAIGLVKVGIDLIGGLFSGSKDKGRVDFNLQTYQAGQTAAQVGRRELEVIRKQTGLTPEMRQGLEEAAKQRSLAPMQDALAALKDRAPTRLGGGGNTATTLAQEDAAEKWISLLREAVITFKDEAALTELREVYARLGVYGSPGTPGRTWAEAERKAIPSGIPGFQYGGLVGATGVALVHRGELVIPEGLTRQLAALAAGGGATGGPTSNAWDNRSLVVNQVFNGVADRDIPRLAVEGIKTAIARDFKVATALEGNTRISQ